MKKEVNTGHVGVLLAAIKGSLHSFEEQYHAGKYAPDTLQSLLGGVQALKQLLEDALPQPTLVHVELLVQDTKHLYEHLSTFSMLGQPLAIVQDDEESEFDSEDRYYEKQSAKVDNDDCKY